MGGPVNEDATEDAQSFEEFYREHFRRVVQAVYLLLHLPADAHDVAQEAFARAWANWDEVQHLESPLSFTAKSAVNLALSELRRRKRAWKAFSRLLADRRAAVTPGMPDTRIAVELELRRLTPRQKAALVLCDFLEFNSEEAASALDMSPSTLRVHLARARARLRERMSDISGSDPGNASVGEMRARRPTGRRFGG